MVKPKPDSNRQLNPPDWGDISKQQFQRLNNLLDNYDRELQKQGIANREHFLVECLDASEIELVKREMDCIDELHRKPMKLVGKYIIDHTVAEGGFGVVCLGFDPAGNEVAIKLPHPVWHLARERSQLDEESSILRDLDHPNIVKFIDCGYDKT